MLFSKNEITSFEKISLELSGMRGLRSYEIFCGGDVSEIAEYVVTFEKGAKKREKVRSAVRDTEEVLGLLERCRVLKWDGFHGAHPRGVLDGIMFRLTAIVNGREIEADGSQNFPSKFHEFRDYIEEKLREEK